MSDPLLVTMTVHQIEQNIGRMQKELRIAKANDLYKPDNLVCVSLLIERVVGKKLTTPENSGGKDAKIQDQGS